MTFARRAHARRRAFPGLLTDWFQAGLAVGARWKLFFWLFAVVGGIEAPATAAEVLRDRSSSVHDSIETGAASSAEISAVHRDTPDIAFFDNGCADDGVAVQLVPAFTPVAPGNPELAFRLSPAIAFAGFQSRAPPVTA